MPFDTQTAREAQCKSAELRSHNPIRELREIQAKLHSDIVSGELTAIEAAQSTRAYIEAEKLKRIIRGEAANTSQSIKSEPTKKSTAQTAGPLEPLPSDPDDVH